VVPLTESSLRVEVLDKMSALITAAFGLVAALAWNTAIQEAFNTYFPAGSGLGAKLGYAVMVTLVAVVLVLYIGRAAGKAKERLAR
jgi:hypothetical protein